MQKWILFAVLALGACTGPLKDVDDLAAVLDPMVETYNGCLVEVASHYALNIKSLREVRVIAQDICEGKFRAIESKLFELNANEEQARRYMRDVESTIGRIVVRAARKARAKARKPS